jgi:hypothetical protein
LEHLIVYVHELAISCNVGEGGLLLFLLQDVRGHHPEVPARSEKLRRRFHLLLSARNIEKESYITNSAFSSHPGSPLNVVYMLLLS